MLTDGLSLIDGAVASNFSIQYGTSLPVSGNNIGELFYLTTGNAGLYLYDGADWNPVTTAEVDLTGLNIKTACRAATTANITLSGEQTIDGVALVTGDRVLVKNQAAGQNNGIYVVDTGAWTRAQDFDNSPMNEVHAGDFVFITEGTTNADRGYVLTTNDPIVIDSTALSFAQFTSGGAAVAGSSGQVQYNSSGVLSADADFTWDATNNALRIGVINSQSGTLVLSENGLITTGVSGDSIAGPKSITVRPHIVSSGTGSNVSILGGDTVSGTAGAGAVNITGGGTNSTGGTSGLYAANGAVNITGGPGSGSYPNAGSVNIRGGAGNYAAGSVNIFGGTGTNGGGIIAMYTAPTTAHTERFRISNTGAWGLSGANYGTAGQILVSNGPSSAPSWQTSAAAVAGTDTQIQFNNGGSFGASSNLVWNNTNVGLGIGQAQPASTVKLNVFSSGATSVGIMSSPIVRIASNGVGADAHIAMTDGTNTTRIGNLYGSFYVTTFNGTSEVERFRILGNGAWSVGAGGSSYGTAGQVLTSNGNAAPTWQTISATANLAGGAATQIPYQTAANTTAFSSNLTFTTGASHQLAVGANSVVPVTFYSGGSLDIRTRDAQYNLTIGPGPITSSNDATTTAADFHGGDNLAGRRAGPALFRGGDATSGSLSEPGDVTLRGGNNNGPLAAGWVYIRGGENAGAGADGAISFWTAGVERMTIGTAGTITMTGSGQSTRFRADFTSAGATRTYFTTTTTNGVTNVGFIPNGTGARSSIAVFNVSTIDTVSQYGQLIADATSVRLDSGGFNASQLPITFSFQNVEAARLLTTGAWSFGSSGTNTGTSGQVLTSAGSGASPTWEDVPAPAKLERVTTFNSAARGKRVAISAGVTIPSATYAAGDIFSFYNESSSPVTITQGSGLTLRWDGTASTGNRTLAGYGTCTVWFNTANEAVISGSIS